MSYSMMIDLKIPFKEGVTKEQVKDFIDSEFETIFETFVGPDYVVFTATLRGLYEENSKEIIKQFVNSGLVDVKEFKRILNSEYEFYFNYYQIEDPEYSLSSEEVLELLPKSQNKSKTK